jgi:hypothetical protein
MRSIALALAAGAALAASAVALASGGQPPVDRGYPPPGVTAIGSAGARVDAEDGDAQAKIRRAVERANERARPRAFADARRKAEAIAAAAGLRLGAVWSVGQDPNVPYPGSGVNQGTFGGNDYCGRRRSSAGVTTRPDGRRVRRYRWRHVCDAPREVHVYLSVTFAQAP